MNFKIFLYSIYNLINFRYHDVENKISVPSLPMLSNSNDDKDRNSDDEFAHILG